LIIRATAVLAAAAALSACAGQPPTASPASPSAPAYRVSTIALGTAVQPYGIDVDPATHLLYVDTTSPDERTLTVLNPATRAVVVNFPISPDDSILGAAVDVATHAVYLGRYRSPADDFAGTVSVVDETTGAIRTTIPVGGAPQQLAADPAANTVCVTDEASDTISVINTATGTVASTVYVGSQPSGVAIDTSTGVIYTANADGSMSDILKGSDTVARSYSTGRQPSPAWTAERLDRSQAGHRPCRQS
jgi:YVTN family beta-propeller protein